MTFLHSSLSGSGVATKAQAFRYPVTATSTTTTVTTTGVNILRINTTCVMHACMYIQISFWFTYAHVHPAVPITYQPGIIFTHAFNNPNDFEGWSCGKITRCGKHQICGGYNVKGAGSEIKKTFMLPAGTYNLELNFIKIDSWSVYVRTTSELLQALHIEQNIS